MAFANPSGPETINGRLAMLAVTSAIAAELASGESVLTQLQDATPAVLISGALIAVGSLIPLMKGADPTAAFGPLTHTAEMANGRAAMLGLAGLLVIELTKGSALF
jgi:Chlorophyll A-B binding protein